MKTNNSALTEAVAVIANDTTLSRESKIKQMRREKKKIIERKKDYSTIYVERKEMQDLEIYSLSTTFSKNQVINTLIKNFNRLPEDEKFTLTNKNI